MWPPCRTGRVQVLIEFAVREGTSERAPCHSGWNAVGLRALSALEGSSPANFSLQWTEMIRSSMSLQSASVTPTGPTHFRHADQS